MDKINLLKGKKQSENKQKKQTFEHEYHNNQYHDGFCSIEEFIEIFDIEGEQ